jgi:hypothetical protein
VAFGEAASEIRISTRKPMLTGLLQNIPGHFRKNTSKGSASSSVSPRSLAFCRQRAAEIKGEARGQASDRNLLVYQRPGFLADSTSMGIYRPCAIANEKRRDT